MTNKVPLHLFHYYEQSAGPFRSLSSLTAPEAENVLAGLRQKNETFAGKRQENYVKVRLELERKIRALFIDKGGLPKKDYPHYMTLGACDWLLDWYKAGEAVQIPLAMLDPRSISFTYGDSFPAMRFQDGKPYRGQVYIVDELPELIGRYGFPQEWNKDGALAPERYIEAQIWDDAVLDLIVR